MLETNVNIVLFEVGRLHVLLYNLYYVAQCTRLPPLGKAVNDFDVFVAGEAEVNEPLSVKKPRRLFQQRNPLRIVVNQVVVCCYDLSAPLLLWHSRESAKI